VPDSNQRPPGVNNLLLVMDALPTLLLLKRVLHVVVLGTL
jgi:hypothetical protein